jgi:arylsulfatase
VDRPNILLIVTDEQRFNLPQADGWSLPGQERIAERGVTFTRNYAAATMCSSSRSVLYTGRHMPITEIHDNDNMPYVDPLDPALGTIGTMLRSVGYHTTYQGKWHLSKLYVDPANPVSTVDALEPYGFSDWNDWGDIDGGAWAGLKVDPVIAGQAVKWLRDKAPVVAADQPWFMAVNFVNPHDIMSFDFGGRASIQLPPMPWWPSRRPTCPPTSGSGTCSCRPPSATTSPAPRWPCASTPRSWTRCSARSPATSTGSRR